MSVSCGSLWWPTLILYLPHTDLTHLFLPPPRALGPLLLRPLGHTHTSLFPCLPPQGRWAKNKKGQYPWRCLAPFQMAGDCCHHPPLAIANEGSGRTQSAVCGVGDPIVGCVKTYGWLVGSHKCAKGFRLNQTRHPRPTPPSHIPHSCHTRSLFFSRWETSHIGMCIYIGSGRHVFDFDRPCVSSGVCYIHRFETHHSVAFSAQSQTKSIFLKTITKRGKWLLHFIFPFFLLLFRPFIP